MVLNTETSMNKLGFIFMGFRSFNRVKSLFFSKSLILEIKAFEFLGNVDF